MNDVEELELTDDQKLALLRDRSARAALRAIPDLMFYVRSIAVDGRAERGETLPEWSAPMRVTAADATDEVYVQILDWVSYWSETLEVHPPATAIVAWRNFQESHASTGNTDQPALGFKAGTTPTGARILTRLQTMWLLNHADQIAGHESASVYQDDIAAIIWNLRAEYPTSAGRPRNVSPRPCEACGEFAVGAEWMSSNPLDVEIRCSHCGEQYAVNFRLLYWLSESTRHEFLDPKNPIHAALLEERELERQEKADV